MSQMTWKEFKKSVDKKMIENKIDPNEEIWYIDISFPDKNAFESGWIGVFVDNDCGVSIS